MNCSFKEQSQKFCNIHTALLWTTIADSDINISPQIESVLKFTFHNIRALKTNINIRLLQRKSAKQQISHWVCSKNMPILSYPILTNSLIQFIFFHMCLFLTVYRGTARQTWRESFLMQRKKMTHGWNRKVMQFWCRCGTK